MLSKGFRDLLLLQNYSNQFLYLYTDANVQAEKFALIEFFRRNPATIAAMFRLSFEENCKVVT